MAVMNTHIGDKIFQGTLRCVEKFRENRPRGVKKSVVGKEKKIKKLEMWANAQRGGRPAEYRWRSLFNAANFG